MIVTAWNKGNHQSSGAGYGLNYLPRIGITIAKEVKKQRVWSWRDMPSLWKSILISYLFGDPPVEN